MKAKMPLVEARAIADEWVWQLGAYCERVEIAGSIRMHGGTAGERLLAIDDGR